MSWNYSSCLFMFFKSDPMPFVDPGTLFHILGCAVGSAETGRKAVGVHKGGGTPVAGDVGYDVE